jgi:hypothetical protein
LGKSIVLFESHFVPANGKRLLDSNRANRQGGFIAATLKVAHLKQPRRNFDHLRPLSSTLQAVAKHFCACDSSDGAFRAVENLALG